MKKKIAIMLTLILAAGTFTACTAEEKDNNDIQASVVSTADVFISEESSQATTEKADETEPTETAEKATVSKETESSEKNTTSKEKSDSGQKSASVAAAEPTQAAKSEKVESKAKTEAKATKATEKPTQSPTKKSAEKSTEKPTEKPTLPPTEAKTVDVNSAVSAGIAYGQQLGMKYDFSLNTANASWFSPTNTDYYDSTSELTADVKIDVKYVADYYKGDGVKPSDISFNVLAENNKIYVVYC